MKLKFLGTGTSQGVPVIGCRCRACTSENPKDRRFRASVMVTNDDQKILVDCGPDFRQQMLINEEEKVDAVLITHEHNDHVIGLDDMRPLIFRYGRDIPIYCSKRVGDEITERFPYAFAEVKYPGAPSFELFEIENKPFTIGNTEITPIEVSHYKLKIFGYKFKNLVYITDASHISKAEKEKLKNLDCLILNCIRKTEPHPAHFILPEVIELFHELKPKKLYLTHLSHHFGTYSTEENKLPENIHLAFDGLEIDF